MREPRDYEKRFAEEDAIRRQMPKVKPENKRGKGGVGCLTLLVSLAGLMAAFAAW